MAKLEIPSIVVENGSIPPSTMERNSSRKSKRSRNSKSEEEISSSDSSDLNRSKSVGREGSKMKRGDTTANISALPRAKAKSNMRLLTRSYAIMESTSPPPERSSSPVNGQNLVSSMENLAITNNNNNIVKKNNSNGTLEDSQEANKMIETQKPSASVSPGNSTDQSPTLSAMDQSGVDLEKFITETLNRNIKDRPMIMKIENDLVTFTKDPNRHSYNFGAMSSYQRMLVHRISHYFGMDHNVDSTGHSVIVNKTKNTRLPEKKFAQFLRDDIPLLEEPRRSILKRDSASFEDTTTFKGHSQNPQDVENSCKEGRVSPDWSLPKSEDTSKLHPNSKRGSRLKKVESYESNDTLKANSLRSSISKSYSFGGYDQNSQNNRVLTKQDSGSSMSSRVSPLSSGYKSQSLRSDTLSATPSPSATPHLARQLSSQSVTSPELEQPTVVWAVTNMGSVPAGSVLIDPQSGEPLTNEDGSIYHYDPENPPNLGGVIETGTRPQYNNGSGTDKSSEVREHDGKGKIHETSQEATTPRRRAKDMLVKFELLNQAKLKSVPPHHNYQNHSQPAQHSNAQPPARHFGQGPSQLHNQQQPPPYNHGMGMTQHYSQNTGGMAMPMMMGPTGQFQPPAQPAHYPYKFPQNQPHPERTGVECSYSHQPTTPMHNTYRIPQNSHITAPGLYGNSTNAMAPNCMMGYMQMPSAPTPMTPRLYQPHMSAPPNAPQLNMPTNPPIVAPQYNGPVQALMHDPSNRARNDAAHFNPQNGARQLYRHGNQDTFMMNSPRRPTNVRSPGSAIRRRTRS